MIASTCAIRFARHKHPFFREKRRGTRVERSRRMRASIFVVLLLAGAAFHCGGSDSTGLATDGGTSGDGATNNPPGCPSAAPAVGAACTVEKLQCAYGTCSVTQRTCTNGTW